MATFDELYAALDEQSVSHLYHFTAASNIPSIREHRGLYPKAAQLSRNIVPTYCSDELSRTLDEQSGLDHFIHLSLHESHAMARDADGRLAAHETYLGIVKIDRSIIEAEGSLYCGDISNIRNLPRHPVAESADRIRSLSPGRLRRAEILIPDHIPFRYFIDSWRWNGN